MASVKKVPATYTLELNEDEAMAVIKAMNYAANVKPVLYFAHEESIEAIRATLEGAGASSR